MKVILVALTLVGFTISDVWAFTCHQVCTRLINGQTVCNTVCN
jgi:hypothetical protein